MTKPELEALIKKANEQKEQHVGMLNQLIGEVKAYQAIIAMLDKPDTDKPVPEKLERMPVSPAKTVLLKDNQKKEKDVDTPTV